MQRWRSLLRGLLVALAPLGPVLAYDAHAATSDSLEYAIKATYLYKFAPFVEWPETAFTSPSSALVLCVAGDDPFGNVLDRAVAGQSVGNRPVVVRRLPVIGRDSDCHIVYVAGSAAQPVQQVLSTVRGLPLLTVTDAARDPSVRGIIHFVIEDNRVRFQIDNQAAAEHAIVISSKLLSLALSVRQRS